MFSLGGSSTLGIGLIIELKDRFSSNANNISKSINNLDNNARQALKNTYNSMTGVGLGVMGIGIGVAKGISSATKKAVEFEKVITSIKALGGISSSEASSLASLAQQLGPKFGLGPIEAAKGMEELIKAGYKAKDIPKVMEAMMMTAVGAGEALGGENGVAARMTDLLMAFKIRPEQASLAGDILAAGARQSTATFNSLAESFKYSQDVLSSFGLTLDQSTGLLANLANIGLKGSMAGIALGSAFRELNIAMGGGSKKKNNALAQMGLSGKDFRDNLGNPKDVLSIFAMLRKGLEGMDKVKRANVLTDLFGVRGKRAMSPILEMLVKGPSDKWSGKSVTDMLEAMKPNKGGSLGSNMEIFLQTSKSSAFLSQQLAANWENFSIVLGNLVLPLLTKVLYNTVKLVEGLTSFAKNHPLLTKIVLTLGLMLIPLGAFLALTGLVGRGLLALRGGMVSWASAMSAAWGMMNGKALTYLGTLNKVGAAQFMDANGNMRNAKGQMVAGGFAYQRKAANAKIMSSTGRSAATGGVIGGLTTALFGGSLSDILLATGIGAAFNGLATLISTPGGITMVLAKLSAALTSFWTFLSPIITGLGQMVSWITGVAFSAPAAVVAVGGGILASGMARPQGTAEDQRKFADLSSKAKISLPDYGYSQRDINLHVHVEGEKTISKKIAAKEESHLSTRYGLNH